MGMTPLEGAVMGTRCGDIDPAIPGFMMEQEGYTFQEMDEILNKKSGILGVTGQFADRRDVLKFAERGNLRCQLALNLEAYRIKKYIGAYNTVIGGADAIIFTAGVGEMGWQIRRKAMEELQFMGIELDPEKNIQAISRYQENDISVDGSPTRIFVIPTNEELVLIEDVMAILDGKYKNHMEFQYSFARKNYKLGGSD
jgi:acetate kinase